MNQMGHLSKPECLNVLFDDSVTVTSISIFWDGVIRGNCVSPSKQASERGRRGTSAPVLTRFLPSLLPSSNSFEIVPVLSDDASDLFTKKTELHKDVMPRSAVGRRRDAECLAYLA